MGVRNVRRPQPTPVLHRHRAAPVHTPVGSRSPLDVIPITAPLDTYDVVVAPALHMLTTDITQRLTDVAHRGGTVITTVMSGRVDTNDHAFLDITPGPLAPLFGIRIDETDAHHPNDPVTLTTDLTNPLTPHRTNTPTHGTGHLVYDIIQLDGAEPVATYTGDWFTGTPQQPGAASAQVTPGTSAPSSTTQP